MQPIIYFPINMSGLIWNQIRNYTTEIDFLQEQVWLISFHYFGRKQNLTV